MLLLSVLLVTLRKSCFLATVSLSCFLLQVSAEDLDSQVNGRITYSILKGDRNNQFWIDPVTGLLKVNKPLDRELVRRRLLVQYLCSNP